MRKLVNEFWASSMTCRMLALKEKKKNCTKILLIIPSLDAVVMMGNILIWHYKEKPPKSIDVDLTVFDSCNDFVFFSSLFLFHIVSN